MDALKSKSNPCFWIYDQVFCLCTLYSFVHNWKQNIKLQGILKVVCKVS